MKEQSNYDILAASVLQNIKNAAKMTMPEFEAIRAKEPKTLYIITDGQEVIAHFIGDIQVPKIDEATFGETAYGSSIFKVVLSNN